VVVSAPDGPICRLSRVFPQPADLAFFHRNLHGSHRCDRARRRYRRRLGGAAPRQARPCRRLVDRNDPGQGTSYGNAGIIEGNTLFPARFPAGLGALIRIALRRAPEADYHLAFLAQVAPWLLAFRRNSSPQRLVETMQAMRPLFSRAVGEHAALMAEADAERYLRRTGWLKLYRSDAGLAGTARERGIAAELGIPLRVLDVEAARALEPSLAPVFRHAVFWEQAASISDPLAVTRAYAARFKALGGVVVTGDAARLHQSAGRWRIDTA
jgi:D-amino-acid dehydrogenase